MVQVSSVCYFGFALFVVAPRERFLVADVAALIELLLGLGMPVFVLLGLLTRTPLKREVWLTLFLSIGSSYFAVRHLMQLFMAD